MPNGSILFSLPKTESNCVEQYKTRRIIVLNQCVSERTKEICVLISTFGRLKLFTHDGYFSYGLSLSSSSSSSSFININKVTQTQEDQKVHARSTTHATGPSSFSDLNRSPACMHRRRISTLKGRICLVSTLLRSAFSFISLVFTSVSWVRTFCSKSGVTLTVIITVINDIRDHSSTQIGGSYAPPLLPSRLDSDANDN
jgi:hypothetical protein